MSNSHHYYLECVRSSLEASLCLQSTGCNIPEIETLNIYFQMNRVVISRNNNERVLIESSINSTRISIKCRVCDELEASLCTNFTRFLTQRTEEFGIMRRKAIEDYHISFLITNYHTELFVKHKLVDFIVQFIKESDQEINEQQWDIYCRARIVARTFLSEFQ